MNKQANYIIQAILLLALLSFPIIFLTKLFQPQSGEKENKEIQAIQIKQRKHEPGEFALLGKEIYLRNCSPCHRVSSEDINSMRLEDGGPWSNRQDLYAWVRDPAAFIKRNEYARRLKEKYGSMMSAFPILQIKKSMLLLRMLIMQRNYQQILSLNKLFHLLHLHQFFIETILIE